MAWYFVGVGGDTNLHATFNDPALARTLREDPRWKETNAGEWLRVSTSLPDGPPTIMCMTTRRYDRLILCEQRCLERGLDSIALRASDPAVSCTWTRPRQTRERSGEGVPWPTLLRPDSPTALCAVALLA